MGAQGSSQRDGKIQEDASASASASGGELSAEVKVFQEGSGVLDGKPLEKNGQISSLTSLNGHSEDNTLAEVAQPDGVSLAQKEEAPENKETAPVDGIPHVNSEKMEKELPSANDISPVEEKVAEEKTDDAGEVGFKKIFTIVGLKFTLKKDKSDETDPVTLLTVKDKEGEDVNSNEEPQKDKEDTVAEEKTPTDENKAQTEASTIEGETPKETDKEKSTDAQPEGAAAEAANEEVKEEQAAKEAETTPPPRETGMSPFRKLFFVGLFSNLRKKSSIKKTKEEEEKEVAEKEETAKSEESTAEEQDVKDVAEQVAKEENALSEKETKEEDVVTEQEAKEETPETPVEAKSEPEAKKEAPSAHEEAKSDATQEVTTPTETNTDQSKHEDQKAEASAAEKVPAEVSAEAELQSSQEKSKHGSPLKKLFTGAGLKKLSTKRQKSKKESESKLTESGEQAADQTQSSAESGEATKVDSGPSSPETSGEHVVAAEANQLESSQETEGEVASDGEKKKDSVIASFRKLVTPKKHAKRSSDSEDEGTSDKPAKSATLSSSESAPLAERSDEEEEKKEDKASEEEPKTENTDKLQSSTEETKKKMDTSVSWEALMCMGGPKKRTRKTSDSDDEETKAEEETTGAVASEEDVKEESKNEDAIAASQNAENEEVAPASEPVSAPPVRESPWSTLKRLVMSKNKPKSEEKPDGPVDQAQQETETQKEESSFSLRKLFPGRKKKVVEKQPSADQGSGEEDSDTPAVVPLSEYDEQVEVAQETPKEAATVQSKVSAEDRAPSWIPASIEGTEDQHDQLSDIPEEENAATPKSADTDIAEDSTEDQAISPKGQGRTGRRLSTAEVKPITPAPAAATSPVPQGPRQHNADEIIGAIEAQITKIPPQTSVTLEDVPLEKASAKTENHPETENADSITIALLEPHAQSETTALCTGLVTKEIAEVLVEQPVEPTLEGNGPVGYATNVEIVVEEKSLKPEEAVVSEDPVLQAHDHKVQTLGLEPVADKLSDVAEIEVASERYEPEIERVGAVSTENSEVIQATTHPENSPKTTVFNAIEPIPETAVCIEGVEVSEVTVETKEGTMEVEKVAAESQNLEGAEIAHGAVVPSDESAVVTETVVLVAPNETSENAKPVDDEKIEEEVEKTTEVNKIHQTNEIETQSTVIAEAVIKEAVDKVLEDATKPKKPTATIPTPVQATVTTESEISIAANQVVITDTPVPDVCERPVQKSPLPLCVAMEVIETVPIEVTESIKEGDNEEEEPKKDLKKAVEVQVSEDAIIEEEVTEIKEEDVEEKESEKDREGKLKETSEDQSKLEAPSDEKGEKDVEIHIPTLVVLQSAEVVEEQPVEVETAEMLDGDSSNTNATAENPSRQNKLPELKEEPQESSSAEAAAATQHTDADESQLEQKPSAKCAEVMAQVIEVIEEAVKEIEPVSTEITAAS